MEPGVLTQQNLAYFPSLGLKHGALQLQYIPNCRFSDKKTIVFSDRLLTKIHLASYSKTRPQVNHPHSLPLNAFISKSISWVSIYHNLSRKGKRLNRFRTHSTKLKPPRGQIMRLLSAAELSQVGGRACLGRYSFVMSKQRMQAKAHAETGTTITVLPILTPFALSFLLFDLLVLLYYICDPTSTTCITYATGGSRVWRGKRISLSLL